jgi:hypothetical protein
MSETRRFWKLNSCPLQNVILTMGSVAAFVHRPVLLTIILGLINASNWCWGMYSPGCTGHEVPMLLLLAIPAGAGVLTPDPAWFTAVVMIIPPVMIFRSDDLQEVLVGYVVFYLANVSLALTGKVVRQRVVLPLVAWLRTERSTSV